MRSKKIISWVLSIVSVAAMASSAIALDYNVKYDGDGQSSYLSSYTVKNAVKQLENGVQIYEYYEKLPLCFEATFETTVDLSGMGRYSVDLLAQQPEGNFISVKAGGELSEHMDWSNVGVSQDEAAIRKHFETEGFKASYESYKDTYLTIEDYKNAILQTPFGELGMQFELGLELSGFDQGSYIKFVKPGAYLITASKGFSPVEQPIEKFAIVLFVGVPSDMAEVSAFPNGSKILVDGKEIEFESYTINQNNYFKLRDVAQAITGTGKQFDVSWNGEKNAINLISSKAYTPVGGELVKGDTSEKKGVPNVATVYKDESAVALTSYTINQNNFFKLRDLGKIFDFNVSWDGAKNVVTINTSEGYIAD